MLNPFIITDKTKIKDRLISGFKERFFDGELFLFLPVYKKREFLNCYKIFLIFLITFFLISIFILIKLQILDHRYFLSLAYGNRVRITPKEAARGLIYDRNGNILAKNIPKFSIYIHKSELDKLKIEVLKQKLLKYLPECSKELEEFFSDKNFKSQKICDGIDYKKSIELEILLKDYPQIELIETPLRKYISTFEMSHILGYVSKISKQEYKKLLKLGYDINDFIGKQGIEKYYESNLRGIKGYKKIEVDRLGREIRVLEEVPPKIGDSLILNIDSILQKKAFEIIEKYAKKDKFYGASFVALDPNTGSVLVLISYPGFNPNIFLNPHQKSKIDKLLNDKNFPLFNRVIKGLYPPGSTFKLVVGASALEEGIISPNFTILSTGGIRINKWFFPDWLSGGHGRVDLYQAIANSVNTYFYIIGGGYKNFKGLGFNKIIIYAKKFGLSKKTMIDLPSESRGFLPSKQWKQEKKGERWYIGDTYHLAIGQGDILVTPLQIALWTSVFANSGKLLKPHIVKEIINSKGEVKEIGIEVLNPKVISKSTAKAIKKGMIKAVIDGTARSLLVLNKLSAAKTGTSQFSLKEEPHTIFTVFYPANNPKIVVTCITEKTGKKYSAIKIVRDFLKFYESNLE